jgi:phage shock protein A
MKNELNNVVRASAVAMSNYNRLDAEYQKYARQSQDWKDRAGLALDAGNEDLAKKALAKKAESDKQVVSMQTSVEQAKAASEKLKQQVGELKAKIDEGERTATTLVARKNAAQAQRKVAEAIAGVGNADNAFAQLNRFEESVSKEEATAKAFDQLASAGKDDDLEKQFAQLGGHSVDAELDALKAERQLRAGPPAPPYIPRELPSGGVNVQTGQRAGEKAGA